MNRPVRKYVAPIWTERASPQNKKRGANVIDSIESDPCLPLVAAHDHEPARHASKEIAVDTPQRFLRYCWSETMTVVPSPPGQLRRPSEMWRRCQVGATINESRRV